MYTAELNFVIQKNR